MRSPIRASIPPDQARHGLFNEASGLQGTDNYCSARGSHGCRLVGKGRPMRQVTDWLEKLGMSEYAQRFAENRPPPSLVT